MIGGPIGYYPIGGVVVTSQAQASNAYRRILLQWLGADVRDPEYVKALEEAARLAAPALIEEAPQKKKKKKTKAELAAEEAQKLTSRSREIDRQLHLVDVIPRPEQVPKHVREVLERLIRDRNARQAEDDDETMLILLLSD